MRKTIVILVAVVLAAGLLFNTGCKKNKDNNITGGWYFSITVGGTYFEEVYDFVGDERTGTVYWDGQSMGTYSVVGDVVEFTLEYFNVDDIFTVEIYQGAFDAHDEMSGTATFIVTGSEPYSGTWFAVKY
ncbi:MAG: hypothetical protein GY950_04395 [bacterium]|nr:hypothetical protein [bacterium]